MEINVYYILTILAFAVIQAISLSKIPSTIFSKKDNFVEELKLFLESPIQTVYTKEGSLFRNVPSKSVNIRIMLENGIKLNIQKSYDTGEIFSAWIGKKPTLFRCFFREYLITSSFLQTNNEIEDIITTWANNSAEIQSLWNEGKTIHDENMKEIFNKEEMKRWESYYSSGEDSLSVL